MENLFMKVCTLIYIEEKIKWEKLQFYNTNVNNWFRQGMCISRY